MKRLAPFLLLTAATALAVGCARHDSAATVQPDLPPARVRVAPAAVRELPGAVEITGTIRALERATLAAKVMGLIEEIPVALGQRVAAGDPVVTIAAAEISARVAQAQAQLNQARRDLAREQALLAQKASTPDLVKSLEDRVALTEALVREAEVMRGYTTVRAPFAGVIARKMADAGDLAAPGMPLLELEGTSGFEVETGVPDSLAAALQPGAELAVHVPVFGATFAARLTELSPAADAQARTVAARLAVPAGTAVRSGQFVRVRVPGKTTRAVLVPATALTTLGQMDRVFLAVDGRAVLRLVKPGAAQGNELEILAGLDGGEAVVVDPPETLREGQPLEVQP